MNDIAGALRFGTSSAYDVYARRLRALVVPGQDTGESWHDGKICSMGPVDKRRYGTGSNFEKSADGRYALLLYGTLFINKPAASNVDIDPDQDIDGSPAARALYAFSKWHINAFDWFNGTYALAVFDRDEQSLLLARDHAGTKPLFYSCFNGCFTFSTRYNRVIPDAPSAALHVNPDALKLYLTFGYIPAPYALLDNTHTVRPGGWIRAYSDGRVQEGRFYDFPTFQSPDLSGEQAIEAVDRALNSAVRRQVSNCDHVGVFLSGGIDSPVIAAKASASKTGSLTAYTIGTSGDAFDESADARIYAEQIGLSHNLRQINHQDCLDLLDDVIVAATEPFADFSIFPTLLALKIAGKMERVMLAGDGADELFWGNPKRFEQVLRHANDFRAPLVMRKLRWALTKYFGIGSAYPQITYNHPGEWFLSKQTVLHPSAIDYIFQIPLSFPLDFTTFDCDKWDIDGCAQWARGNLFNCHMNLVLQKVSLASIHENIEIRYPYLDLEVVQIASRIDWRTCLDLNSSTGKIPLRKILNRHIDHETRAKKGFTVPMGKWLSGPLEPIFLERLANRESLLGFPINSLAIMEMFQQFKHGRDCAWSLWLLLSLALWHDKYLPQIGT